MAGLAAYALAGGLAGAGSGLLEDAKAQRDAVKDALRRNHEREMAGENREFQRSERMARQDFDAEQKGLDRSQRLELENLRIANNERTLDRQEARRLAELERQESAFTEVKQDETGKFYGINKKGEAKAITDEAGEPVTGTPPRRKLEAGEMTAAQTASAIRNARRDAEVPDPNDPMGKAKIVDYKRYADNLSTSGVPMTPALASEIKRGLRSQIEAEVQAEAEERKEVPGGLLSRKREADYGGMSREEWTQTEVRRRLDETMMEFGLADPKGSGPQPGRQDSSAPATESPQPATSTGAAGRSDSQRPQPPAEYPDAVWSDRAKGYVVKRDGKWFLVEER